MKLRIEIYCVKDIKNLTFNCVAGKSYSITYDTNSNYFNHEVNEHLVKRLKEGYFRIISPWRYLPKHRELNFELYNRISKLTSYCEEYYLQLENSQNELITNIHTS